MRKIKIILSAVLLFAIALAFTACINKKISDLIFEIQSDGTYALTYCLMDASNDIVIPETYKGKAVTKIGDNAFKNCYLVESITVPKSIKSIGADAFFGTEKLTKLNYLGTWDDWVQIDLSDTYMNSAGYFIDFYLNDELVTEIDFTTEKEVKSIAFDFNQFFYGAKIPSSAISAIPKNKLSKLEIVSGLAIPDGAFLDASSLKEVTLSSSIKSIGEDAFKNSPYIEKVNFNGTVSEWASIDFKNAYANPLYYGESLYINGELVSEINISGTTKISDYAFINCQNATAVTIGEGVTSIGDSAFSNCKNINSVQLAQSTKTIGESAFAGCGVSSFVIPDNVTTIGRRAFDNCSKLTSVTIGKSVQKIENQAFYDCVKLEKVNYTGSIDDWVLIEFEMSGSFEANPIFLSRNLYLNDVLVTEVVINASVVKDYALYCCDSLTSVTLGDGVTSVGYSAFWHANKLSSVVIGKNVKQIELSAFASIALFNSVTFEVTEGWYCVSEGGATTQISSTDLQDSLTAKKYLGATYCYHTWKRD